MNRSRSRRRTPAATSVLLVALAAALLLPGTAGAAGVSLRAIHLPTLGHSAVALAGDRIAVRGAVTGAVAGPVTLRLLRRGHLQRSITVTPRAGHFQVSLRIGRPGRLLLVPTITTGSATPAAGSALGLQAITASLGDRTTVRVVQGQLAALHYYVPSSGSDGGTRLALLAYRKVNGMSRTSDLGAHLLRRLLRGVGTYHPRFRGAKHAEANLALQIVALVNPGGRVFRIFPTSSGKPSTPTVLGRFHVYMKDPGTNSEGMYKSNYFIGGYAIHGYPEVPTYAASHGCLRVPNSDAPFIFGWLNIGDEVDVYYP